MANTSSPSSVARHSMGDLTMFIVEFTNMVTASTWASKIPGTVGCWLRTYAGATTGEAALLGTVNYTNSDTGTTFTFLPVTNATTGTLFALSYA